MCRLSGGTGLPRAPGLPGRSAPRAGGIARGQRSERPAVPVLPPEPPPPPARVGRYTITGQIGQGGVGAVFAGTDPLLGRTVAIKLPRNARTPAEAENFLQEARRLAQLKHPGIVTV